MRPGSLLVFLYFVALGAKAQEAGARVKGQVFDRARRPVAQATLSWQRTGPESSGMQALTRVDGSFEFRGDTGRYRLRITHASFADTTLTLTLLPGELLLDSVFLRPSEKGLQHITVTARRPLIEHADDRITYNVESDPSAKTESATDLLRKTPLVTVDGEGNIQLNGQSNFRILLNGRETSLFAQSPRDALRAFPGAVISKIEVITAPSAKWDAEGVGGLINIITKKKVLGYNGSLSQYYSTLSNYSQSLSLNGKAGKLGVSIVASRSGSVNNIRSLNFSETLPLGPAPFQRRVLEGERLGRNLGGSANLELVYDADSFHTLAGYGTVGWFNGEGQVAQTISTQLSQGVEGSRFQQLSLNENRNSNFGVDYIQRFRGLPGKELSFRGNALFSRSQLNLNSRQWGNGADRYTNNRSEAPNREYTLQADLTLPLAKKQKLEAGLKTILRSAASEYAGRLKFAAGDPFLPDPGNTDRFRYEQNVYSAFGSYSRPLGKYQLRLGLRAELTEVEGDFVSSLARVHQEYLNLIPNLLLTRNFTPTYTATFSYTQRLQRPAITSLNPFVNNQDSLNISFGNPDLGPQVLHAWMWQNRFTPGKLFITLQLNGSYTNNLVVQYAQFHPQSGVTATTSANFGREYQLALGWSLNGPVGKKLTMGVNAQLRYNEVANKVQALQQSRGFSGSAFGNFNYKVVGKFTISGSGGLTRSPYTLVNSPNTLQFYQVNFGYKFLKDKLAVTMNVNNFHDRFLAFRNVTEHPDVRVVNISRNPYRVVYFGATYTFGKLKENVSKKKGVSNDDLIQ